MHGNETEFLESITGFVGSWYLFAALMNTGAALYLWRSGRVTTLVKVAGVGLNTLVLWGLVATVFVTLSGVAFGGGVGGTAFGYTVITMPTNSLSIESPFT